MPWEADRTYKGCNQIICVHTYVQVSACMYKCTCKDVYKGEYVHIFVELYLYVCLYTHLFILLTKGKSSWFVKNQSISHIVV